MLTRISMFIAILAIAISLVIQLMISVKKKKRSESLEQAYSRIFRRILSYIRREFSLLAVILALFFGVLYFLFGKNPAVYFLFGSVTSIILLIFSTFAISLTGMKASIAEDMDENKTFKSVRMGAISIGMISCGLPLLFLTMLYRIYSFASVLNSTSAYAFGVCLIGFFVRAKSGAYTKILDIVGSFVCSAAAVILLSDVSILEAGVGVQFSRGMAAVYAFVITAAGIAVSFLLSLTLRGKTPTEVSSSLLRIVYLTSGITGILSIAFSYHFFGSIDYCIPGAAGVTASVIFGRSSEIRRASVAGYVRAVENSPEGGAHMDRNPLVRTLRSGLLSSMIPVAALGAAVYASYYFAGFYGISLAALTASSTAGIQIIAAVIPPIYRNAHIIRSFQRLHTKKRYKQFEIARVDLLSTGDGLAIAEASLSAAALYSVYTRSPLFLSIDISSPFVLIALLIGVMIPFGFLAGSLGEPIKAELHMRRRMIPGLLVIVLVLATGFVFGAEILGGEIVGIFCSGILISLVSANSGAIVRLTSESAINTLIKFAAAMALTFLSTFDFNILL
ncbi:MAG: sodium/proton-translocating pyrophosphatase [Eubacteriales bacterium]|nr:sodium/proton-translocating pyrophosphatase [Eubacteriales bacterium]